MDVSESPDYEPGKIFVGGLSWETDDDAMRTHFEQFGKVAECKVMKDDLQPPEVKKNRGFGFVVFEDPAIVDKVVAVTGQTISGKVVDPKKAQKKSGVRDTDTKVFIGGLGPTTEETVKNYFNSKYGGVKEVIFKVNPATQRKRGFGFVVFETAELVKAVLQLQYHEIDGRKVEVKKAEPRSATKSAMQASPGMYLQAPYGGHADYSGANGGGYGHWGAAQQQYHQYYQTGYPNHQQYGAGGGGGGVGGGGYGGYDQSAYSRTQPTSGDHRTHDPNSYYQHQQQSYGHHQQTGMGAAAGGGGGAGAAGGAGGYGHHDTSGTYPPAPPPTRGGYSAGHGGYGQHAAGYGRGGMQQQRYTGSYNH